MYLLAMFWAEALVPVAFFYGIAWLAFRPAPARWSEHLTRIVGAMLALGALRYGSAFTHGGNFALHNTLYWAIFAPAILAGFAAWWLREKIKKHQSAQ